MQADGTEVSGRYHHEIRRHGIVHGGKILRLWPIRFATDLKPYCIFNST
jgi:hypothetical protein